MLSFVAVAVLFAGCESMGVNPDASIGPPGREARGGGIFSGEDGHFGGSVETSTERDAREEAAGAADADYQAWKAEQERAAYEAWKAEQNEE